MKKILITAHSGCEGTPDNSMESILRGIGLGADCVEIDIRMDAQGKMWLTHDEPEQYGHLVPLETALRTIAESGISVNCDLKQEKLLYPVLEAAENAGIPRKRLIFSGSVSIENLLTDSSIVNRARIFLNMQQIFEYLGEKPCGTEEEGVCFDRRIEDISALVKKLGVECINPTFKMMPHGRIMSARAHGIGLSLWTVNEEEDQARLMGEDLINMTTRRVESALRIRGEAE